MEHPIVVVCLVQFLTVIGIELVKILLILISIGTIPSWRHNKPDAKALLAYLPKINNHQRKHNGQL